jgi:hypothetical protein
MISSMSNITCRAFVPRSASFACLPMVEACKFMSMDRVRSLEHVDMNAYPI